MEKAYKFRLYPNNEQTTLLIKTFGCVRFVYNQTLAARKDAFAKKISLTGYDCVKMLPAMKKDFPWLKEVDWQGRTYPNLYACEDCVRPR